MEYGIENTISIDGATRTPGLNNSHHVSTNNKIISENQSLNQDTDTLQADSNHYVIDSIIQHVV